MSFFQSGRSCLVGIVLGMISIGVFPSFLYAEDTSHAIESALEKVQEIKLGIDEITQKLFALDQVERGHNPDLDEKYRMVRNEIVRVITSIGYTTDKIMNAVNKLSFFQTQIQNSLKDLQTARSSSSLAKSYYEEYLVLLHKIELELYDPQGDTINEIRLLLHSDAVTTTLVTEDIVKAITAQLADLITQADREETRQKELLIKLGELRQEVKKTLNEYHEEVEKLQQKKQYLENFLSLYQHKQQEEELKMQKIFSTKKEIHTTILAFLDEIIHEDYKSNDYIKAHLNTLFQEKPDTNLIPLAWPIYPIEKILRYFGDADFEKEYGFKFTGIEVEATQGTAIYAVKNGVVYHVSSDVDSVSWLMIVHQDGYVSVYEYLNTILVQPGDFVERGQLIGYSGGEPGTYGAGFASDGAKLLFEVYKNGAPVDPLNFLDLSVVTHWQDILPEEYKLKYLSDSMIRPIDVSDLQIMSGDTVDERSANFLSTYGKGIYRNLTFWDSVVEGTNIDRDMVICVAFAESTLGHYLSTANNIGNVGNNDRGDRIAYSTPYYGARLIPETLNNVHLGNYHTINQLSRYGNSDGKIYASSPINWQTNVLKCLSKIKGYTIPEDFPFRIGPNPNL